MGTVVQAASSARPANKVVFLSMIRVEMQKMENYGNAGARIAPTAQPGRRGGPE